MKIKVEFSLDVDAEAWATEYGVEPAEVRQDVKRHVEQTALAHLDALGVLA